MNSQALTITSDRIDLYLYDTREFGALVSNQFRVDLWLNQGLANFNLQPHCDLCPLYHGDVDPNSYMPHEMNAAITLVDGDREVLDQVEFSLDARTTRMLGVIFDWQSEIGWMKDEVEMRTWWMSRGRGTAVSMQMRLEADS